MKKYYIKIYSEKDLLNTGWKEDERGLFKQYSFYTFPFPKILQCCGKVFEISEYEYNNNISRNPNMGLDIRSNQKLRQWCFSKDTAVLFTREVQ